MKRIKLSQSQLSEFEVRDWTNYPYMRTYWEGWYLLVPRREEAELIHAELLAAASVAAGRARRALLCVASKVLRLHARARMDAHAAQEGAR